MNGARVGEFDVTELFECLKVEYDADRVFMQLLSSNKAPMTISARCSNTETPMKVSRA